MAQLKKNSTSGGMPIWHSGNLRLLFEIARAQGLINDKSMTGDWLFSGTDLLYQDTQKVVSLTSTMIELNSLGQFSEGVSLVGDLTLKSIPGKNSITLGEYGRSGALVIDEEGTSISGSDGDLRLGQKTSKGGTEKVILASELFTEDGSTKIASIDGKLYDVGERVFSPSNPPPVVSGSNRLTNSGYGTGEGGRLTSSENLNDVPVQNYTFQFDNFEKGVRGTLPEGVVDNYNSLLSFQRHRGLDYQVQLAFVGNGAIQYRPNINSAWDRVLTKSYADTLYASTSGSKDLDFYSRELFIGDDSTAFSSISRELKEGSAAELTFKTSKREELLVFKTGDASVMKISSTGCSVEGRLSATTLSYGGQDLDLRYLPLHATADNSAKLGDVEARLFSRNDSKYSEAKSSPTTAWWHEAGYGNSYYLTTGAGSSESGIVYKLGGKNGTSSVWLAVDGSQSLSLGVSDAIGSPLKWSKILNKVDCDAAYLGIKAKAASSEDSDKFGKKTPAEFISGLDALYLPIKGKSESSKDSEKLAGVGVEEFSRVGTLKEVVFSEISTRDFLIYLMNQGAFLSRYWVGRGSKSADNNYVVDTGDLKLGKFSVSNCFIEVVGVSYEDCTVRVTTPTTSRPGCIVGRTLTYSTNLLGDSPSWRSEYSSFSRPNSEDTGSLSGLTAVVSPLGAAAGWQVIAKVKLPSKGSVAKIEITGGAGSAAISSSSRELIIRSEGSSAKLTCTYLRGTDDLIKNVAWKKDANGLYEIHVETSGNDGLSYVFRSFTSDAEVTFSKTSASTASKPSGLTDGDVVKVYSEKSKPTAEEVLAVPVTKASGSLWTDAQKMAGKNCVGGYRNTSAENSYMSFCSQGAGVLDFFLDGEIYVSDGTSRVFHEKYVPTPEMVGALATSGGGTVSGRLIVSSSSQNSLQHKSADWVAGLGVRDGSTRSLGELILGIGASSYDSFMTLSSEEVRYTNSQGSYKVFHEGNLPSIDTMGAAPINSPNFKGSVSLQSGLKSALRVLEGASIEFSSAGSEGIHYSFEGGSIVVNRQVSADTRILLHSIDKDGNVFFRGRISTLSGLKSDSFEAESKSRPSLVMSALDNGVNFKKKVLTLETDGSLSITTLDSTGTAKGVVKLSPGKSGELFHTGNPPTSLDVGALSTGGGTLIGRVVHDYKSSVRIPSGLTSERGPNEEGSIRFNKNEKSFEGCDGEKWAPIGSNNLEFFSHTGSAVCEKNKGHLFDTSTPGSVATLPTSVKDNDFVTIGDSAGKAGANPIRVDGFNGDTLVLDTNNVMVKLTYVGGVWKVTEGVGESQLADIREYVMNGDPVLSAAWIQLRSAMRVGYAAADGQLLSRELYPDAWAAIEAGLVPVTTEETWLTDPRWRGAFTAGNGRTTFRVPDYNGKSDGSLGAAFQRGDGLNSSGFDGSIQSDAIRNITASSNASGDWGIVTPYSKQTGAFFQGQSLDSPNLPGNGTAGTLGRHLHFDASRVVPTAADNHPVNVTGCWAVKLFGAVENPGSIDAAKLATELAEAKAKIAELESWPQSGSNINGYWMKHLNGFLECWLPLKCPNKNIGMGTQGGYVRWTYPHRVVEPLSVVASANLSGITSNGVASLRFSPEGFTEDGLSIATANVSGAELNLNGASLHLKIIGRWK